MPVVSTRRRYRSSGLEHDPVGDFGNQLLAGRAVGGDGAFAQGGGEHFRLDAEGINFCIDQGLAVFAEE